MPPARQPIPFGPSGYDIVHAEGFGLLDEVWRDGVDAETRCVLPRTMTERAVHAHRDGDFEQLIVHYMQPHEPHIGHRHGLGSGVFVDLRQGRISRADAWRSYLENLRVVLDEVAVLRNNIDAKRVVITADHGEAFGGFGFYAHQIGNPLPAVRRVPWVETDAVDRQTLAVGPDRGVTGRAVTLEEHLADLGYG